MWRGSVDSAMMFSGTWVERGRNLQQPGDDHRAMLICNESSSSATSTRGQQQAEQNDQPVVDTVDQRGDEEQRCMAPMPARSSHQPGSQRPDSSSGFPASSAAAPGRRTGSARTEHQHGAGDEMALFNKSRLRNERSSVLPCVR